MTLPRIEEAFLEDGAGPSATLFHSGIANVVNLQVTQLSSRLFSFRTIIDTAINADRIIQAFNSAVIPINGTQPDWEMLIQANAGFAEAGDDFASIKGMAFPLGLVFVVSTTKGVLTVSQAPEATIFGSFVPVG